MPPSFFCPRCGLGGLHPSPVRVTCIRCGMTFAVPQPAPDTKAYDICTIVLLWLVMPAGLILLWAHPSWPLQRKWTLTAVAVLVVVLPIVLALAILTAMARILPALPAYPS